MIILIMSIVKWLYLFLHLNKNTDRHRYYNLVQYKIYFKIFVKIDLIQNSYRQTMYILIIQTALSPKSFLHNLFPRDHSNTPCHSPAIIDCFQTAQITSENNDHPQISNLLLVEHIDATKLKHINTSKACRTPPCFLTTRIGFDLRILS